MNKNIFENKYLMGFIIVGTTLYASLAAPILPKKIVNFMDHPITKIIMYMLIVFLVTQNITAAIVVAIAFYVLMSTIREQKIADGFIDGLRIEGFI
jgi:hypothetical protein